MIQKIRKKVIKMKFNKLTETIFEGASEEEAKERYWNKVRQKLPRDVFEKFRNEDWNFDFDSLNYEVAPQFPNLAKVSDMNGEVYLLNGELLLSAEDNFGGLYFSIPVFDFKERSDKETLYGILGSQF